MGLWLVCVELMGIFLDSGGFFAGSFFKGSFVPAEDWADFAEVDALADSLSLAALELLWASEAALWPFLIAPCGVPCLAASPPPSSELPFASAAAAAPAFPPSVNLRGSFGLRAVLKKDMPLSSVLLFLLGPLDGGVAAEGETPTLEDRRLVIEELLLELGAPVLFSTPRPGLPSALLLPLDLEGGPPCVTFRSETALVREDSRLMLLSAALVLAEAELFSPAPLGDIFL